MFVDIFACLIPAGGGKMIMLITQYLTNTFMSGEDPFTPPGAADWKAPTSEAAGANTGNEDVPSQETEIECQREMILSGLKRNENVRF